MINTNNQQHSFQNGYYDLNSNKNLAFSTLGFKVSSDSESETSSDYDDLIANLQGYTSSNSNLMSSASKFRITSNIINMQVSPISINNIKLTAYRTANLNPINCKKGEHGGYLITVEINKDFKLIQVNRNAQKFYQEKKKYEARLKDSLRAVKEHDDGDATGRTNALKSNLCHLNKKLSAKLIGFEVSSDDDTDSSSDMDSQTTILKRPKNPNSSFDEELFKFLSRYPSYSDNPESSADPQGDINWTRFLPKNVRELFGFSSNKETHTFPDHAAINGAIDAYNRAAEVRGLGPKLFPFKLAEVDGQVDTQEYLNFFANWQLPVARPKSGSSWFYHDLLYHVIGMLLTPRDSLIGARWLAAVAMNQNSVIQNNVTNHLDHSTTWALRITASNYLQSHASVNFFCWQNRIKPIMAQSFKEKITIFGYFGTPANSSGTSTFPDFKEMRKPGYFIDYATSVRKITSKKLPELIKAVNAHRKLITSIL